ARNVAHTLCANAASSSELLMTISSLRWRGTTDPGRHPRTSAAGSRNSCGRVTPRPMLLRRRWRELSHVHRQARTRVAEPRGHGRSRHGAMALRVPLAPSRTGSVERDLATSWLVGPPG